MRTPRSSWIKMILVLVVLLTALRAPAGAAGTKRLTYGQVFLHQEPQVLKMLAPASGWFDAETYLRTERDEKSKSDILYKVKAKTGEKTVLLDYGAIQTKCPSGLAASAPADITADFSGLIYSFENDLYYYSVKTSSLRRLTQGPDEEKNPTFSPDGRLVAFTRRNNLFAVDLVTGREVQLTGDGSDSIYNGWASWVYYEEILGRPSHYRAFWWSPDSRSIAFLRFDDGPVPVFPLFSADGPHGRPEPGHYPQSGDPNPKVRLGVVSAAGGAVVWADFDPNADQYLAWPVWLPDSSRLTVQWMNREQKDLKVYVVDPARGTKTELYDEKQPTWVEFFEDLHFFKDRSGFLVRSDRSGWRHLYYYDLKGKLIRPLTAGEWSVISVSLVDEKNRAVYFMAEKDPSTETHLYRVRLDGTHLERLTQRSGSHWVEVAPSGGYFLDSFSSLDEPARQDLCRADGRVVRNIDQRRTPLLDEYALGRRELFTITTADGWNLPAGWILPLDFDAAKKYPVIFNIYSGPGTTDVANRFPQLSSFLLAQEGIIVFAVDHRGSSHFGKKGQSLMYRNLGKWEIHDLTEAVRWLRTKPFIDPTRMGITGGSYGGYMTCLAMTAGADYFTHGFASSSVTDWTLYDSVYTERYMDKPTDNPEGYRAGSVQTYADKLKGVLFLEHGDMDDNVHMQNSVQLISKLMDAGRNFEFMLYPDQRHGFRGTKRDFSSKESYDFWMKNFFGR
jgi:dipeptidyl-peptidase-4